jgi:hypothetical protein
MKIIAPGEIEFEVSKTKNADKFLCKPLCLLLCGEPTVRKQFIQTVLMWSIFFDVQMLSTNKFNTMVAVVTSIFTHTYIVLIIDFIA